MFILITDTHTHTFTLTCSCGAAFSQLKYFPCQFCQVHESGRLVGVGAGDGSTSVLSLEPELVTASKAERATALDMLEREARWEILDTVCSNASHFRRERILENRAKALKVAARQAEIRAKREKTGQDTPSDTTASDIENAEKMFFETVRRIKLEREQRTAFTV